jgi:ABC-type multidrug transport system fused ATPase/permease subunit
MTVSMLAGYSLSRFKVRGGQSLGLFILTAKMLPATLLVIPLFGIFRQLELIGSLWSIILAHATLIIPFTTWMLKGYFDTIPRELEQAAMVDGCSPLGAMVRVILPVSAPGLAATALYGFVLSWSDYAYARTFLTNAQDQLDRQSRHHHDEGRICQQLERHIRRLDPRRPADPADLPLPRTLSRRRSHGRRREVSLPGPSTWPASRIEHVTKSYGGLTVLKDFSLDIADGEFVVLVGPSGCGKSTMLKILAGLEEASSGKVSIGERDVTDLAPGDRDIAMVFQNYALYPHLTVAKNMGFGLKMRGTEAAEIERRVTEAAKILGIDHLLDRRPRALSGGQRQRVALGPRDRARAARLPDGRAALESRRQAARPYPRRDQRAAQAPRRHHDLCHA